MVQEPRRASSCKCSSLNQFIIRVIKYTPAVTSVEECTKADTGVGAAMAAGSHALKGSCALFVQAATIKRAAIQGLSLRCAD